MVGVFVRRLKELSETERANRLGVQGIVAARSIVRTPFTLPPSQHAATESAIKETLGTETPIQFETAQGLISGIELTTNGQKVAWSIADYLGSLEKGVTDILKGEESSLMPKAESNPKSPSRIRQPMNTEPESFNSVLDRAFADIAQAQETFTPKLKSREVGTITSIATGIAKVSGLPGVGFDELLTFPGDVSALRSMWMQNEIGVVLLGEYWHLHAGDEVSRTGRVMDVAVGDGLLGRVLNPLGRPLDGNGPVVSSHRLPIERPAPPS